jgi:lipoate-protein ligase A
MAWRVLEYRVADPAWNMAVDEAVFSSYLAGDAPPTLRFYGWDPPTLSVGYFQDLEREVQLERVRSGGFGLVRRTTGGRAVLHDRELTYAVIAGARDGVPEGLRESYRYIALALVAAFQEFGVAADLHLEGIARHSQTGACFDAPSWYELTVDGRKLVGSAQLRKEQSFLQHGSILLDFSAADLASLLKLAVPEADFCREMAGRVTSLAGLGRPVEPERLAKAIVDAFQVRYGIELQSGELTPDEVMLAQRLAAGKYGNDPWNLRRGHTQGSRLA